MKNGLIKLLAALALLLPATFANAAAAEVVDNAGFFSRQAVDQANQKLAQIHQQYGRDLRIETFPAIPDDVRAKYGSRGENELYARWAYDQARAAGVRGAIVVITKNPAHLQVDVGEETRRQAFTIDDRNHLRDTLLTNFKAKRYDQGLASAVDVFANALAQNRSSAPPAAAAPSSGSNGSNPTVSPTTPARHGSGFGTIIFWIAVIFFGFMIVRWLIGRSSAGPSQRGYGPGAGPGYGGYGYGGGGFGRGFGGGILGGLLGGWLGNRVFGPRNYDASAPPPPPDNSAGGGSFDSGPSDFSSDSGGYQDIGGGGDFGGGGGGGDMGGGGDFGGGGDSGGRGDFS